MTENIRICVDARPFIHISNGNARYLHRMLSYLTKLRKDIEWILLSHKPLHQDYADLVSRPGVVLEVDRSWKRIAGPVWMNLSVPEALHRFECDLFWGTLAMLPLKKTGIPAIVNFHDLNSMVAPDSMTMANRFQHRMLDHRVIQNADRVVCLSGTTRSDILRFFPDTPESKLDVVYPGADWDETIQSERPSSVGPIQGDFFFSLGTIEPRKNFGILIDAYLEAKKIKRDLAPLVVAGRKGWNDQGVYERLKSGELQSEGIYFVEGASDREVRWLFENCFTFLLPSKHEGFGLPIIEAYQSGKPAILSDIGVFREIGGNARYCRVDSIQDWRNALVATTGSEKGRQAFSMEEWSWEKRAKELSEALDRALR